MSYLARIEPTEAQAAALPATYVKGATAGFSLLEWSIIRLSRVDSLSSLRTPGVFGRFIAWLTGRSANRKLANPRLEALRRISVLSWHHGYHLPGEEVADFLSAGFTPDHYELLVRSIHRAADFPSEKVFPEESA